MKRTCYEPVGAFSVLRNLFVLMCVLIAVFFVAGYASGWITFQRDRQKNTATIEIDTGQMKAEANEAAQKGEQLLEKASEKIRGLGDSNKSDSVPTSIQSEEPQNVTRDSPPASPSPQKAPDTQAGKAGETI